MPNTVKLIMGYGCGCCASAFGYTCGGLTGATGVTTTDKTNFRTEVTAAVATAALLESKFGLCGIGNPDVAAYIGGGLSQPGATYRATTDKLIFATDITSAMATANLTIGRTDHACLSERSTKGYFSGGTTSTGPNNTDVTDLTTFSTDITSATATANLSQARNELAGITEGSTKGYFAGGSTSAGSVRVATADLVTYSTDVAAAQVSANLTQARLRLVGSSNGTTFGFFSGGSTGAAVGTTDRITFNTDTTSTTTISLVSNDWSSMSDGTVMYVVVTTTHTINFSTEVVSALASSADLSIGRSDAAAVSVASL